MGGALAPRQRSRRRSPGLLPPAGRPGGPHGQAGAPGWRPAPSTPVTKQAARVPRAPTRFLLEEVAKEQRELMGRGGGGLTDSLPGPSPPWVAGHQTRVLGPEGAPKPAAAPHPSHTLSSGDTTSPRPPDPRGHTPGSWLCDDLVKFSLPWKPNPNRCAHLLTVTVTEIHEDPLRPSLTKNRNCPQECDMNGTTTLENRPMISYK